MRRLVCTGSATEIGTQVGQAYASMITDFVRARLALLREELPQNRIANDRSSLQEIGSELVVQLATHCPEEHAEFMAMSKAAGVDPALTILASAYTDAYDLVCDADTSDPVSRAPNECSSFLYSSRTGPQAVIAGQTWDMPPDTSRYTVLLERQPSEGRWSVAVTLVTGLSYMGCSFGSAVFVGTTNMSTPGVTPSGVVFPAVVSSAIAAGGGEAAVARILALPSVSGHYYYVADVENFVGAVEVNGRDQLRLPSSPRTVHTNHFVSPAFAASSSPPSVSSAERYNYLALHGAAIGTATEPGNTFKNLLRQHDNGVCKHDVLDPGGFRSSTGGAILFESDRKRMSCALGFPCTSEWLTIDLGSPSLNYGSG
jgi:hypothetical protein